MKRFVTAMFMTSALLLTSGCGASSDGAPAEEQKTGAESTVTGTLDEVKDFMFVLTDENGDSYGFDFEQRPQGLDDVAVGDPVTVTYTGEISMVDPFEGTIVSVEPAK